MHDQFRIKKVTANFEFEYEFGLEYEEYTPKKAAGIALSMHIRPLSEIASEEHLEAIPIDNKVGENYLGQMTDQLHRNGGTAVKAIGGRLVLILHFQRKQR